MQFFLQQCFPPPMVKEDRTKMDALYIITTQRFTLIPTDVLERNI